MYKKSDSTKHNLTLFIKGEACKYLCAEFTTNQSTRQHDYYWVSSTVLQHHHINKAWETQDYKDTILLPLWIISLF